eukprot:m.81457 g.81457  ORF g.81457 m.81457 type:complete len:247 (-) comp14877_c1_seq3:2508-3248(-)
MAEKKLDSFLNELKQVEQQDSQWTSAKQIERLTKPGSKYLNLNPYEVLQLEPGTDEEVIKKQYRKLSILVHPDKNRNDQERAKKAFDAVTEANKMLQDEDRMHLVRLRYEEAHGVTERLLKDMKKQLKADKKPDMTEEEEKEFFRKQLRKVFADCEVRKEELERKTAEAKKREAEAQDTSSQAKKVKESAQKEWEEGREVRVNSWRDFTTKPGAAAADEEAKKKKKSSSSGVGFLRPPKLKQEQRS